MTYRLAIEIKPDAQNILVGFPYMDGQFEDGEQESEDNDNIFVFVNLSGRTDTTAAQEQFLNTKDDVIGYSIV